MKKINFYYVRHGETIFNVKNLSQGSCDSPLTKKGIEQANKTKELLKDIHFNKVFSSSSERATDTAYEGENRKIFENRIKQTFQEIVDECDDNDNVLIVSHRGYFYYMLEALFDMNLDELEKQNTNYLATLIPNASIARFSFNDGIWKLKKMPQ